MKYNGYTVQDILDLPPGSWVYRGDKSDVASWHPLDGEWRGTGITLRASLEALGAPSTRTVWSMYDTGFIDDLAHLIKRTL